MRLQELQRRDQQSAAADRPVAPPIPINKAREDVERRKHLATRVDAHDAAINDALEAMRPEILRCASVCRNNPRGPVVNARDLMRYAATVSIARVL